MSTNVVSTLFRVLYRCTTVLVFTMSLIFAANPGSVFAAAGHSPIQGEPPFATKLQPLLMAKLKMLHTPGAIIYIDYPGQGTWATTMGTGDIAKNTPMSLNDHMRIGSITKTLTGTVILQLAQEGKLKLDDPVSKFQPEVPNGAHITVRDLLQMTSGLYNYSEDKAFNQRSIAIQGRSGAIKNC